MTSIAACFATFSPRAEAQSDTAFSFGGYVKLDMMNSYYRNGNVAVDSALRDFHLPSAIPVGPSDKNFDHHYHAKESRFHLQTDTKVGERNFKTFVEFDFLLSTQGNEKVSNSYSPRLRHFYFETGNWIFGQTWSTFMVIILPEDLDFTGAAEGVTFNRQPQMRYSRGGWQFSIENSQTAITLEDPSTRVVSQSGTLPDAVARKNFGGEWGILGVAAMGRMLNFTDSSLGIEENEFGFGGTLGTRLNVGERDNIIVQATAGKGLGRYIAVNFVDGAAADSTGSLSTIDSFNGLVGYQHFWTEKLRSSANASLFLGSNPDELADTAANKKAQSYSINLLYSPVPGLMFGAEYMHAKRNVENGMEGRMDRIQLSVRHDFGYKSGD